MGRGKIEIKRIENSSGSPYFGYKGHNIKLERT
jgi:hypothetical protein